MEKLIRNVVKIFKPFLTFIADLQVEIYFFPFFKSSLL